MFIAGLSKKLPAEAGIVYDRAGREKSAAGGD
jgi:hypothetical protein